MQNVEVHCQGSRAVGEQGEGTLEVIDHLQEVRRSNRSSARGAAERPIICRWDGGRMHHMRAM